MQTVDFPPNPLQKAGYILDFNDEFDGQHLDLTKWVPYYLPQWSSREQSSSCYQFGEQGFSLHIEADQLPWCPELDGDLKCSSIQTGVFSGEVGSTIGQHHFKPNCVVRETQPTQRTYTPQYGYFEIRFKAVASPANMVALWMIGFEATPEESGEIAIVEVFGDQITATGSEVCYGVHPWQDTTLIDEFFHEVLPIDATQFHIYAVEWTPMYIDFYVDNMKRRTIKQSPAYPMQFMLGIYEFPDLKDAAIKYPKRFVVDYFRGYQPMGGYTPK